MAPSILSLRDRYAGRTAFVLGGGPSLLHHVRRMSPLDLKIGVNDHAARMTHCDYAVFVDRPVAAALDDCGYDGPRISPHADLSSYDLDGEIATAGFSSPVAVALAVYMGCSRILLGGMDCYQGDRPYWHSPGPAYHEAMSVSAAAHLVAWRHALGGQVDTSRVRALGGPLVDLFGLA